MKSKKYKLPIWVKTGLLAAPLIIIVFGATFFHVQKRAMHSRAEANLASIARLKVDQIAAWRRQMLEHGDHITTRPYLAEQLSQWLLNPQEHQRERLLTELAILQQQQKYINILLVDANGDICLNLPGPIENSDEYASELSSAFSNRVPVMTELHADSQVPQPHLSVVAPIFADNARTRPIGAIILLIDPSRFLYPLIQSWPVPSQSAETLLVRKDGNDVLFLNTLRHRADTALKLRIPLSQLDLPAAMAIRGKQGVAIGNDYRGVKVVSVLLPVPDSPWYMVTKMDADEIFAPWRPQAILIVALFVSTLGILGALALLSWQHAQKNHLLALYRTEADLRAMTQRHSATLKSIGDAVIVTNARGEVELLNSVAQELTGWSMAEAVGKPVEDVFHKIDERTRSPVENPVSKVLRSGRIVGPTSHSVLLRRGGGEIPIDDSGAPIQDEEGHFLGVVLVFRDTSERKRAEKVLRESELFHRQALESIPGMVFTTRPDGYCDYQSQQWVDYTGVPMSEHLGDGWNTLLHPEDRPLAFAAWRSAVEGRAPYNLEYRVRRHDGAYEWFKVIGRPIKDEHGRIVRWFGVAMNIQGLKKVEQALRENERRLSLAISALREREEQLKASLAEKEVLLKEIHHRVKNNMQIISSLVDLQASEINDAVMLDIFQDVIYRVRSMAMVHEKLYQSPDLAQVEFADYIQSLLGYFWRAQGAVASGIQLNLDLEQVLLPVNAAVPCGLILNELISNALKHAFPKQKGGEVAVSLQSSQQGEVVLCVRDNGRGLPAGFDWSRSKSLGLRLVQMLSGQLHADVEVSSDGGTEFKVIFARPGI